MLSSSSLSSFELSIPASFFCWFLKAFMIKLFPISCFLCCSMRSLFASPRASLFAFFSKFYRIISSNSLLYDDCWLYFSFLRYFWILAFRESTEIFPGESKRDKELKLPILSLDNSLFFKAFATFEGDKVRWGWGDFIGGSSPIWLTTTLSDVLKALS